MHAMRSIPSGERLFISTKTEILAINLSYFWRYTCLPHVTNNHHLKIPLIPFHLFVCSKKIFYSHSDGQTALFYTIFQRPDLQFAQSVTNNGTVIQIYASSFVISYSHSHIQWQCPFELRTHHTIKYHKTYEKAAIIKPKNEMNSKLCE